MNKTIKFFRNQKQALAPSSEDVESPDDIPLSEWEITATNIPDMEPPACKKRRKSRQKKKSYYHN